MDKITFFVASENHFKGLEVASSSYHKILEENRVLYNQVQDLKGVHLNLFNLQLDHLYVLSDMKLSEWNWFLTGTIRVYCRVRPFLPGQSNGQSSVDYIGENGNIMIFNPYKQGKDARRVFSFNKVYGTNVTQGMFWFNLLLVSATYEWM